MKDKDVYKILNNADTKIPQSLESVSNAEIDKLKENFLKSIERPKKTNRFFKYAIAALLALALMGFTKPGQIIYAQIVNFYEKMTNPIAEYSIESEIVDESITRINSEISHDGVKFQLADAMLDEKYLVVNMLFEVTGEELIEDFPEGSNLVAAGWYKLLVNGKNINYNSGTIKGTIVDDKTHQQYYGFDLKENLSEEDVLTLVVKNVSVFNFDEGMLVLEGKPYEEVKTVEIPGEWTIDFKISDSKEKLKTKFIEIEKEITKVNDYPVVIKNLRLNAFRATLNLDYENESGYLGQKIYFKATDEKGVEYNFIYSTSANNKITFHYYGEEGKDLMKGEKLTFQGYQSLDVDDKGEELYTIFGEEFEVVLE